MGFWQNCQQIETAIEQNTYVVLQSLIHIWRSPSLWESHTYLSIKGPRMFLGGLKQQHNSKWISLTTLCPFLQEPRNCAKSYTVSCQPFTVTVQFKPQVSPCGTCGGQSGNRAGFSLNTLVFTCQFKVTNGPYSFPHLHGCCRARIAQSV